MRNFLKAASAGTLALVVLLVAFRQWRATLYEGLPPGKVADIETDALAALVFGIALVLVVLLVVLATRRTPARTATTVEGDWHELADVRPPTPQLPAPRYVNIPRYTAFGSAQPLGAPRTPETIITTSTEDQAAQLEVPLKYLRRFAALDGPTREHWQGKTTAYTDARRFFTLHGFLDDAGKWKPEYPLPSRRQWLEQFDEHAHQ